MSVQLLGLAGQAKMHLTEFEAQGLGDESGKRPDCDRNKTLCASSSLAVTHSRLEKR